MKDTYELPPDTGGRAREGWSRIPSFVVLGAAVAALYFAREVFIPLAFAVVLTLLVTPVIAALQKLHIPRVAAVLVVIVGMMAAVGGVGWIIANQLVEVANELPKYRENIHNKIVSMRAPSKGALARAAESVKEIRKELSTPESPAGAEAGAARRSARNAATPLPVQVVEPPTGGIAYLQSLVAPFLAPLAETGIVLVFTIFLTLKQEDVRNRLFRLAGLSQLNVMTRALDDAATRISRYLMLQFLVNSSFGLLFWLGLELIGMPYAALWGAVAGLFRIVPYVGTIAAATMPIVLSLAVFDGWAQPAMVFGLFAVIELVVANVIEPLLYGSHTGVSSLAILVSAVFWTTLWGPAGLILATPLTVCVVVLGRYIPQLSFLHILLGDEPVLEPEAHLYQRLLAMDLPDARAVADKYCEDHSVLELYDNVIIPALALAEQDRHKGALDPVREEFVYLSVGEIIAESSSVLPRRGDVEKQAGLPTPRILCIPASDAADEVAGAMLGQLLEHSGFAVVSFPVSPPREILDALSPQPDDVICISALPPFALGRARAWCRQIRGRFPDTHLVVGIWGMSSSADDALRRFEKFPPDQLATTLGSAMSHLTERVQPGVLEEQTV